jgi:hypothetical protein
MHVDKELHHILSNTKTIVSQHILKKQFKKMKKLRKMCYKII